MKAYSVREDSETEWHIIVVAENAQRAKVIGFNAIKSEFGDHWVEYLKIRVSLLKNIVVPEGEKENYFTSCESQYWMCPCWTGCEDTTCPNYTNRRIIPGEKEQW